MAGWRHAQVHVWALWGMYAILCLVFILFMTGVIEAPAVPVVVPVVPLPQVGPMGPAGIRGPVGPVGPSGPVRPVGPYTLVLTMTNFRRNGRDLVFDRVGAQASGGARASEYYSPITGKEVSGVHSEFELLKGTYRITSVYKTGLPWPAGRDSVKVVIEVFERFSVTVEMTKTLESCFIEQMV
jgi:hypothetical protein